MNDEHADKSNKEERQLIALILKDRDLLSDFRGAINPEFLSPTHRLMYEAIVNADANGVELTRKSFLEWVGKHVAKKQEIARLEVAFNCISFLQVNCNDYPMLKNALRDEFLMRETVRSMKEFSADKSSKGTEYAVNRIARRLGDLVTAAEDKDKANVISLADVESKEIEWLWNNRFPLGKIVLLYGDPGLGKSMLTLDCVAKVTTGEAWSDGAPNVAGKAVIISAEDDLADTIRPRLEAAGANVANVYAIETVKTIDEKGKPKERVFSLADIPQLEQVLDQRKGIRLVVIDPVSAFLNGADSHRDSDIRQLLTPLAKLAARHAVTILLVTHMSKGSKGGQRALYRSMGSIGIAGAARAAYLVCQDPNDIERRLMLPAKSNLGPDAGGLSFCIDSSHGGPRLAWQGAVTMTADEALRESESNNDPQRSEAREFLERLLADGEVDADGVLAAARSEGISKATLYRAKAELKIESPRLGFGKGGRFVWQLPREQSEFVEQTIAEQRDDWFN